MNPKTILETKNLKVYFQQKKNNVKAVNGVDIVLREGLITSLAGESGCGKTTLARAILGFNKPDEGSIFFKDKDITLRENNKVIRENIQIVFQNPFSSLDPRYNVFSSLYETLCVFKKVDKHTAEAIIKDVLAEVELEPDIMQRYPHQLSGGQIQRICIARSLLNKPSLVVLDEPISSLDGTTASKIMKLLGKLQKELGVTFLFISHNLKLLRKISNYSFVMYCGKIMEHGPKDVVYDNPLHPYTKLLKEACNQQVKHIQEQNMDTDGCPFINRCPFRKQVCSCYPQATEVEPGHFVHCHLHNK